MKDAIQAAGDAGALVVVAAGNQGQDLDTSPTYPASYSLEMDHVITIGATALDDTWASFSNYGQAGERHTASLARLLCSS